ncbi:hypothetical protein M422DRAFT_238141 [Sphaerobolus stellatus SS14]|nr:hypothetical protein M422DRAFT_238141 [Sphaerobolus stellatus SS14]
MHATDALKSAARHGTNLKGISRFSVTPEEEVRILKRRLEKAERDERMDITTTLTPPKTYMGGFTRPRDLRASNWYPGGPYILKGKKYEIPHEDAYKPHTVFLAETRYKVRQGTGRVDARNHVVGICRTQDWHKIVKKLNSRSVPREYRESLDNACWPWLPDGGGKVLKQVKWWGPDENLEEIMKEIYEDPNYKIPEDILETVEEEEVEEPQPKQPPYPGKKPKDLLSMFVEPRIADTPQERTKPKVYKLKEIRKAYMPIIKQEPFWRPLVAIGFSTRPLALTLARLARGMERGTPFYATIPNEDRKCLVSFDARMRNLRLNRMRQLVTDICKRLAGYQGGFIGIRFNVNDRGRTIGGEGLEAPLPPQYRIVDVRVAEWYSCAEEEMALYKAGVAEWGAEDALRVELMNEWGQTIGSNGEIVPWSHEKMDDLKKMDEEEKQYEGIDEFVDDHAAVDIEEGVRDEEDDESVMEENTKKRGEVKEEVDEVEMEEKYEGEMEADESDQDLLASPRKEGREGMKRLIFKATLREDSPRAKRLRRELAYKWSQRHSSVLYF